jgi:CDP-diacylglycerol--glycerol-3-phosphate 3-phosphatidyltransferase
MNLPNKLTITRMILVPIIIIFMLPMPFLGPNGWNAFINKYGMLIALILFSVASYTDHLDGSIARRDNLVTNFGKFLDPIADKLLIISVFIAFVELGKISSWVPIIILAREFAVTGIRLLGSEQGKVIPSAMLGKIKMVVQIVAIILLMLDHILQGFFKMNGFLSFVSTLALIVTGLAVLMTLLSGLDYIMKNKNLLKN